VLLKRLLDRRDGVAERVLSHTRELTGDGLGRIEVLKGPDGPWVATDAVEGESLRWVMATLARNQGFIAPNEGLAVVTRIAQLLEPLHRANRAHGDICPCTVFITHQGDVLLHDVGVATALGPQGDLGPARSESAYVAPEQISGDVQPATDVFRLGLLLYELAVGRPLFSGPSPAHICHAAVSWQSLDREKVQGVPEPWLTLLMTMLTGAPEDRPGVEEIGVILEQAISRNRWSATRNDVARLFARASPGRPPFFDAGGAPTQELMLQSLGSNAPPPGAPMPPPVASPPPPVTTPPPPPPAAPSATSGSFATVNPSTTPPGAVVARIATKKMTREELAAVKLTTSPGLEALPPDVRALMSLVEKGVITRQQLELARSTALVDGIAIGTALVNTGADEDTVVGAIADVTKTQVIGAKKVLEASPGADVLATFTLDVSRAAKAIPITVRGTQLMVAMADPLDAHALELVTKAAAGKSVMTFRAGERAMAEARKRLYPGSTELELESGSGPATFDPMAMISPGVAPESTVRVESPTAELAGRVIDALLRLHGARGTSGANLVGVCTELAQRAGLSPADIDLARVAAGAMVSCALLANRQPWDVPKLLEVQDTVGFGSPVEAFVEGLHSFPARMPERPVVRLVVLAFAFAMHAGDPRPTGARVQGALNSFKTRVQLAQPLFDALSSVLNTPA